jgi:hypothetical protein
MAQLVREPEADIARSDGQANLALTADVRTVVSRDWLHRDLGNPKMRRRLVCEDLPLGRFSLIRRYGAAADEKQKCG